MQVWAGFWKKTEKNSRRIDRVKLLIVGCGYVGKAVARLWQEQGHYVRALTRGGASIDDLKSCQIEPIVANWLDPEAVWSALDIDAVLVAVPHRPDPDLGEQTYCAGMQNIVRRVSDSSRIVVLSTTGVYAQCDGQSVNESSSTEPTRPGPKMALAGERWVLEHLSPQRATVLRLAGIYGPGRVPLLSKLQNSEPIPVAEGGYLNLIHLVDIVDFVTRLLSSPAPSPLYVLSDGHPIERRQFYLDAARIFQTPAPVFTELEPGSTRAGRSESNKRIDPSRIIEELKLKFRYPNHLVGLASLADS